jgi:hypothetical protein
MVHASNPSENATNYTMNNYYSENAVPSGHTTSQDGSEHPDHDTTTTPTTVELRQKFMEAEEVYLYKIPPLQTSGGHRYGLFFRIHC